MSPTSFDPKSQLVALLTQPNAVGNWNSYITPYKHLVNFDRYDFSDYEIPGIDFSYLSFNSANFAEANLQGANLCGAFCWKTGFIRANLSKA